MNATINQPFTSGNGAPPSGADRGGIEALLTGEPLTAGYVASTPLWFFGTELFPQLYIIRDVELIYTHPMCHAVLEYYKGGIAGAEFVGPGPDDDPGPISDNPEVAKFVSEHCRRFWDRGVP